MIMMMHLCTVRLYAGRQIKLTLLLFSFFCLEGSVIIIVIVVDNNNR